MIALLDPPTFPPRRSQPSLEESVRSQVWRVLGAMYPHAERSDRRGEERFPYPRLVYLRPVAADGVTTLGEPLVVVGKHLSQRGLGFFHPSPLPHRLMIVTLERVENDWLSFLLDVSWCRFRRQGWYESGGRFLRPLPDVGRPE